MFYSRPRLCRRNGRRKIPFRPSRDIRKSMEPVPSTITKTYAQRGPLQQFRFAESTAFRCFRCGDTKKSKLITVYNSDWSKRLCNGCYGRLLSLYEIKAGTAADDQKAEELAAALLWAVTLDLQRQAESLFSSPRSEPSAFPLKLYVSSLPHSTWLVSFRLIPSLSGHRQSSASAKRSRRRSSGASCDHWPIEHPVRT
jgi:hypothetical protein